jgi:hypothetical protein
MLAPFLLLQRRKDLDLLLAHLTRASSFTFPPVFIALELPTSKGTLRAYAHCHEIGGTVVNRLDC